MDEKSNGMYDMLIFCAFSYCFSKKNMKILKIDEFINSISIQQMKIIIGKDHKTSINSSN